MVKPRQHELDGMLKANRINRSSAVVCTVPSSFPQRIDREQPERSFVLAGREDRRALLHPGFSIANPSYRWELGRAGGRSLRGSARDDAPQ